MTREMTFWTIVKCGVYEHFVPGFHNTLDEAIDAAKTMASNDGFGHDPDGYHHWKIYRDNTILEGVVTWEQRRTISRPASGLGWVPEPQPEPVTDE